MSTTYIAEPPKFRSLYIFMNKNAHFIILVSFCRPHSDLLFMTNVPSSLVLLSMYKDSEIYRCILNFYLSNTIVLNFWKGPELLVVIILYLYLLERKLLQKDVNEHLNEISLVSLNGTGTISEINVERMENRMQPSS